MRAHTMGIVLLVVASAGCSCSGRTTMTGDGGGIRLDTGVTGDGGGVSDRCLAAAEDYVYVVDDAFQLMRFDPETLTFIPIGTLSCPSGGATPFSMAVDRDARAWVLHQNGEIFFVSTQDASCSASGFAPNQMGFELFGMGFVADADMSEEETLYVAGGAEISIASGMAGFASIDDSSLVLTRRGDVPGWPELTGTGSGELWGFFPDTSPPTVRQIDKSSGADLQTFDLGPLAGSTPSAWAFAFWGGRFFVFLQTMGDPSTNVWRLDPSDGSFTQELSNTGYRIVGAGVSTCAPVDLI
jgi:hypothetical protein